MTQSLIRWAGWISSLPIVLARLLPRVPAHDVSVQHHLASGESGAIASVDDGEKTHIALFEQRQIYKVLPQGMQTDVFTLGARKTDQRRLLCRRWRYLRIGRQYLSICVTSRPGRFGDRGLSDLDTAHDM